MIWSVCSAPPVWTTVCTPGSTTVSTTVQQSSGSQTMGWVTGDWLWPDTVVEQWLLGSSPRHVHRILIDRSDHGICICQITCHIPLKPDWTNPWINWYPLYLTLIELGNWNPVYIQVIYACLSGPQKLRVTCSMELGFKKFEKAAVQHTYSLSHLTNPSVIGFRFRVCFINLEGNSFCQNCSAMDRKHCVVMKIIK